MGGVFITVKLYIFIYKLKNYKKFKSHIPLSFSDHAFEQLNSGRRRKAVS